MHLHVSRIWNNEARWLFLSPFWPLLKQAKFFETAEAVMEIGLSLKTNRHNQL